LANREVQEFSEKGQKPKEARLLHEVSIPKVILQAQDIFHGKWSMIISSFFTPRSYLSILLSVSFRI